MSRIFEHPNMNDFACPICGTQEDKRVVLVPIQGTREGVMVECEQVHLDCLLNGLMYYKQRSVMALLCSYGENPDFSSTKKYLQKKKTARKEVSK